MNKKQRKLQQKQYAKLAFEDFLKNSYKLDKNDRELEQLYVKELILIQTSFNLKLSRNEKLLFCKKCLTFHPIHNTAENKTQIIRLNPKTKTKNYICKRCGNTRRIKF